MTDQGRPGRRTSYHHGDLRAALLAAAEAELAEKGIEGFTLRGCAKRANVSHAAPAHHFRDANALLTELAAIGFGRFVAAMQARQAAAGSDPRRRLVASGLGYVDFAGANPALFRLMFSSFRPDFATPALDDNAAAAFANLVDAVKGVRGPAVAEAELMTDVAAAWSTAHGLAELVLTGRMRFLNDLPAAARDDVYADIFNRSVPDRP